MFCPTAVFPYSTLTAFVVSLRTKVQYAVLTVWTTGECLNVLDERSIKAAVIDRLLSTGALNDAVLINEMVYANWSRRADLAVANGHLHAFEIKSDFDSLRRLEGQIAIYLERFDKLTLVVSPKFLDAVLEMTPSRVAVWSVSEKEGGAVHLKVVREGKREKVENRDVLIDYLLREELYRFLSSRGVPVRRSDSRSNLVKLAKAQPVTKLRAYVLQALKERYQESFNSFIAARNSITTPNDLVALRKAKGIETQTLPRAQTSTKTEVSSQLHKVQLDLSRLFPSGEIPAEVQTSISVRNRVPRKRRHPANVQSHSRSSSSGS